MIEQEIDFEKIAAENMSRGLKVHPVRSTPKFPNQPHKDWLKVPAITEWPRRATRDPEQVKTWAHQKSLTHANVGIACNLGVGETVVLDCDAEGLVAEIEAAIQKRLLTYSVSSRPQSAPHKVHLYFRQTQDFVSKIQHNINAADVGMRYDLKCNGGQVLAAGSHRLFDKNAAGLWVPTDEKYERNNDLPVSDILTELTDWFLRDKERWARFNREAFTEEMHAPAGVEAPPNVLCITPRMKVPASQRWRVMQSEACSLASRGYTRRGIAANLTIYAEDRFEDGEKYARENQAAIHKLADDTTLKFGNIWCGKEPQQEPAGERPKSEVYAAMDRYPHHERWVPASQGWDWIIAQGFPLDRNNPNDKKLCQRARDAADPPIKSDMRTIDGVYQHCWFRPKPREFEKAKSRQVAVIIEDDGWG